jgi:hypothetical protein
VTPESAMVSTGAPESATATATTSSDTSTAGDASEGDIDDGDDDAPQFDLGVFPDLGPQPPPVDCDQLDAVPPFQGIACEKDEMFGQWVSICQPPPLDGACGPITDAEREALDTCAVKLAMNCSGLHDECAPVTLDDGSCCYWGILGPICPGRPFVVAGHARLATLREGDAWCDDAALHTPFVAETSPELAELLAQVWLFDARHEHAAIASFSRFALQLLAMAAPPRFVDAALRAALDEREHAGLFFALARVHGGRAWAPGPLAVDAALDGADDPIHIVAATIHEGCIAETISALQLQAARDAAKDPALREALSRVLEQELAHVELAWAVVAWALAQGDATLRAAVVVAFADPARWIPRGPDAEPNATEASRWREHGRLTEGDRVTIARHAIRTAILPAARRLLDAARENDRSGPPADLRV